MTDSVPNTDDLDPTNAAGSDDSLPEADDPTAETMRETAEETIDDAVDAVDAEATDEVPAADAASMDGESGSFAGDEDAGEEDEAARLRRELDEVNDRHLRLAAEFNNFRRRNEAERLESWSRAQADLVEKFLDVLDDLHRVADLDLSNATVEAIMEGIDLVERKFVRQITEVGVEMIDPVGEAFDPERMEAMMRVPTEDEAQDDTVAAVFQKGYTLKGILVRPARVSVHKHG